MRKFQLITYVLGALVASVLAIYSMFESHNRVVTKGFEGEVVYIEWKSPNHQIPLILVKAANKENAYRFHHSRISLTDKHIKVGDRISKAPGEVFCLINDMPVRCID